MTPEEVPRNGVYNLQYDSVRDILWACDGKEVLLRSKGEWRRIGRRDGLLDANCHSLALEPNGDVWLGYDAPAFALIRSLALGGTNVKNYSGGLDQVSGNNRNVFLGTDRRGWLWRASDADYLAAPAAAATGEWLRFDEQDGILEPGGNSNAFTADPDGSVWFANEDMIFHLSLAGDFVTRFPAPTVFVSGFSIDNHAPALADTIDALPHGSDLVAHIGSLQFERRNALQWRYRLLPDRPAWALGQGMEIHIGKLGWGKHRLELEARLASGPWLAAKVKSFAVLRPIWLSRPAMLGFLMLALTSAAGAVHVRKRSLERAKKVFPEIAEWRLSALSPELHGLHGRLLDARFEVGRVIARGGFATVVEGTDLQQGGRPCAVKIFREGWANKEWITKRFRQEVLALQQIQHPNVVRIYGHGATPVGAPYLVMEFVSGKTLRELLEAGALSRRTAARYLEQTGSALSEIHSHGICHRDLKPENLMIRGACLPDEEVVLIDFSTAIVKDPDETIHGLSRAAGTLYYMAPEQTIGYADASSDIYSLAKVLIEMLTGQRLSTLLPDASIDLSERVRELLAHPPFRFSVSSIDLLSAALEFDPFRRPKNAKNFADAIAQDLASLL